MSAIRMTDAVISMAESGLEVSDDLGGSSLVDTQNVRHSRHFRWRNQLSIRFF